MHVHCTPYRYADIFARIRNNIFGFQFISEFTITYCQFENRHHLVEKHTKITCIHPSFAQYINTSIVMHTNYKYQASIITMCTHPHSNRTNPQLSRLTLVIYIIWLAVMIYMHQCIELHWHICRLYSVHGHVTSTANYNPF